MARQNMVRNRQLNARVWAQRGGCLPGNPIKYLDKAKGQMRAGALTLPASGTNIITRPSDDTYGTFDQIGQTETPPEQGTITLMQDWNNDIITFLEEVKEDNESLGVHVMFADDGVSVGNPNAWRSKIVIPDGSPTTLGFSGDIQGPDSDEVLSITSEVTFFRHNRAVRVTWQELLGSTIATPGVAVAFGETRKIMYAVTQGDGTTTAPKFYYSTDRGVTWTAVTFTHWTFTEHPTDLIYVGGYLIAPSSAALSYAYASEDDVSASGWTEVATGFVASKTPNAAYADTLSRVYFAANGGYIYVLTLIGNGVTVLTDGTLTAQNLNHIDGKGDHVVAVGASNVVLLSTNGGESFALKVGPAVGVVLNTVAVLANDVYVVGAANGNLYYTNDGCVTWNSLGFPGSGAGSVTSVKFLKKNPAFGLLGHQTAGNVAKNYRTTDGGNTWEAVTLTEYPTSNKINRFAMWDANTLLAIGTATTTTDGTLALAKPARSE